MEKRYTSFHRAVEEKIKILPDGSAFVASDFCDTATADTASRILLRLCESGAIHRIVRGVYSRNNTSVSPCAVAAAIARNNSWQYAPCGETAVYLAGLSAKVPDVWTFVADGTYREYVFDGVTLRFLHSSGRLFATVSSKTALAVQVIKAYGRDKLDDEILRCIGRVFCRGNNAVLLRETKRMNAWIRDCIKKMCSCCVAAANTSNGKSYN